MSAAAANVVMQLSQLPVGHGVARSTVESGRLDRHPLKRLRTTLSYLAVALLGADEDRRAMRAEVNRSHRQVHSGPGDPVAYDAFDPDLQLWVAACLYRGLEMSYHMMYRSPDEDSADVLYAHAARLGTTLQVSEDRWPAGRQEFERYWSDSVQRIEIDDTTRRYLLEFSRLGFLPTPIRALLGPFHEFMTSGFLPGEFRERLGLSWGPRRQRAFGAYCTLVAQSRRLPGPVRQFPLNLCLWDARRRIKRGAAIV